jgi:serine/threonine-protein kinase
LIGRKISHYSVTAKLGEGGMGEVYRATDTKLGRDVALKVLPEAFASDAERMARFQREAQVLASLNHPNIASIYGLEEADGVRCLVLELVEGETLAERIAKGPIPLDEALPIARQVAEALETAHERGVIHRDLKPGNIKVTPESTVKVLDFGLAKAFQGEETEEDIAKSPTLTAMATQAGIILGTAAYMSPEQAKGKRVDRRADIWAFGVVLFEMLSGKQVFRGETVSETLAAVMMKDIDWNLLPADTPPHLHRLLRRCLDKDPKSRLRDIGEARLTLEGYLADPSTSTVALEPADISATGATAAQPVWLRRLPWAAAGVLGFGFLLLLWGLWHTTRPIIRPAIRLPVQMTAEQQIAVGSAGTGGATNFAISADGTRIAYVLESGGSRQLYVRSLDKAEETLLSSTEGAYAPFFSPDGEWVAFFANNALKKVSVSGGAPLTLCDVRSAKGGSWGPDDTIVFAPHSIVGLSRVPAAGGTPEAITETTEGVRSHRWPQFLPGGQAVLFMVQPSGSSYDDSNIEVLNLETGEREVIHQGGTYPRYLPSGHLVYAREGTLFGVPFDLDRMEMKGSPAPLLEGLMQSGLSGDAHYAFSDTGTLLYLSGTAVGGQTNLAWVDMQGSVELVPEPAREYYDLRFSPRGDRLALTTNEGGSDDVWVYDFARDGMTRLTFAQEDDSEAIWTPDGRRVTYSSEAGGTGNLYWTLADGSGQPERLTESNEEQGANDWSPDGKVLIFGQRGSQTRWDLWALHLDEDAQPASAEGKSPTARGRLEPYLQSPFNEGNARFSPDGRWLAYQSNETGRVEVFVRPFPDTGGKVQISTDGGSQPVWAPRGRELYYRVPDGLMAVSFSVRGNEFRGKKPRQLLEVQIAGDPFNPAYDVEPGGRRFLVRQVEGEEETVEITHLNFILNWFDELRQRVPTDGN